jgi:hypothetical protein
MPPQDGLQHATAIRQAVCLADQPHSPASRTRASHRRAEVEVLPACQSDPTGTGRTRWTMQWKPVINAFAITFADRFPAAETY